MMVGCHGFALSDRRSSWSSATVVSACDRCGCAGRRASHTTPALETCGSQARPRSRTARPNATWRGNISASVSAPARRGRCPDRLEDLLGHRRDATGRGTRPTDGGWTRSPRTEASHCSLPQMATFVVVGPRLQRPPVSPPRPADRSRRWSKPERILAELGASGGSVVSAGPRRTIGILPSASVRSRFGGDVSPIGVVLLPGGLLLYLFDGVEEGRDDGRGYRRIGGRGRPRLRRAVHLIEGTLTLRGRLG